MYKYLAVLAVFIFILLIQLTFAICLTNAMQPDIVFLYVIYHSAFTLDVIKIELVFLMGLVTDIIYSSILGTRSLIWILIITCINFRYKEILSSYCVVKQSFIIFLLSLIEKLFIKFIHFFLLVKCKCKFNIYACIANAIFWPFLRILFNKLNKSIS